MHPNPLSARAVEAGRRFVSRTWWVVGLLGVGAAAVVGGADGEDHLADPTAAETSIGLLDAVGSGGTDVPVLAFAGAATCDGDCGDASAIWLAGEDGRDPVQVTRPVGASDRLPRWAPDGSALVFTRVDRNSGAGEIMIMRGSEGTLDAPRPLTDTAARHDGRGCDGSTLEPVWSPSSTMVAVTCASEEESLVLVVPAEGGPAFALAEEGGAADGRPTWSPDGRIVAFARRDLAVPLGRPERIAVWTAAVSAGGVGEVARLISGDVAADHPSWSPSGQQLAYVERDEITLDTSVAILDLGTGTVTRPWSASGRELVMLYHLAWSPDAARLAFPAGDGFTSSPIVVLDLLSQEAAPITDGAALAFAPRWSADGSRIVFDQSSIDGHQVLIHDLESGTSSTVGSVASGFDGAWGVVDSTARREGGGSTTPGDPAGTAPVPSEPPVTLPPPTLPTLPPVPPLPELPDLPEVPDPTLPEVPGATLPSVPPVATTVPNPPLPGQPPASGATLPPTTVASPTAPPAAPTLPPVTAPTLPR